MESLTKCWFTREHLPDRVRRHESDGSLHSTCRYCRRPVVTWDRRNWSLANGIDLSRLAEMAGGRVLTLIDTLSDYVVRRFTVAHLASEEEVEAYKLDLRAQYRVDEPDSALELRDSAPPRVRRGGKMQRVAATMRLPAALPGAA